jgi:hypothetical protein
LSTWWAGERNLDVLPAVEHTGEELPMKMKRKPLQVSLHVKQPSVVELTVEDKVQLDRLTPVSHGYVAERHGDLIEPGVTTLHLDQGRYFFKTLSEAHLRVVQGGIDTAVADGSIKEPPAPPPIIRGDAPAGEVPMLTVEQPQEAAR